MAELPSLLAPHFGELAGRFAAIPSQYNANAVAMLQLIEAVRHAGGDLPISVTSWYRSPIRNVIAGGSRVSQHLSASAMDFTPPAGVGMMLYFRRLAATLIPDSFGQLIYERDHLHISLPNRASHRTGEVLIEVSEGHYTNANGYTVALLPGDAGGESGGFPTLAALIGLVAVTAAILVILGGL